MPGLPIPDDWVVEDGYHIAVFCFPKSAQWRALARGAIYRFSRGWTWDESTGTVVDVMAVGRDILESYCVADLDDMVTQLTRIADAAESVDLKVAQLYSWADFISDLENTLGVSHIVVVLVKGFFDLMPNLKLKMDAGPIALATFEYFTWRAPILAAIATFLGEMAVVSASLATSAGLATTNTVLAAISGLADAAAFLRDIAFGNKNFWDDLLKPLWDTWTSTDDGGAGGDDPDSDPTLNNMVNVFVRQEPMVTQINLCGGCGTSTCGGCAGDLITDESGRGTILDQAEFTEPVVGEFPPAGWSEWTGSGGFYTYKCKAANVLVLGISEALAVLHDVGDKTYTQTAHHFIQRAIRSGFAVINQGIGVMPFVGPPTNNLTNAAQTWTANQLAKAVDTAFTSVVQSDTQLFYDLRLHLLDQRQSYVCDFYNAPDTDQARTDFLASIDAELLNLSYSAAAETWARDILEENLTNEYLNQLWQLDNRIDRYSDSSAIDCSVCSSCQNRASYGTITSDVGGTLTGDGANALWLAMDSDENFCNCGNAYAVDNIQVTAGSVTAPGGVNEAWRFYSVIPTPDSDGDVYNSNSTPSSATTFNNCRWLLITSTTSFTVSFDYVVEP